MISQSVKLLFPLYPLVIKFGTQEEAVACLLACLLAAFSLCLGGNTYMAVFNLPARRQPHSVFRAFVHAGTICMFLDP